MKHTRLTFAAFVVLIGGARPQRQPARHFLAGIQQPFCTFGHAIGLIVTVSYIGNLVFLLVGGNVIERFEKKKRCWR